MLTLGFDTSAAHCAAVLIRAGEVIASRHEDMTRGQAERLFPMIDEMLAETGHGWRDLSLIGVGTGPGNFTGIRLAVAAARGLALSLEVPAIGVTRFDALALGLEGRVLALVDARRGHFHAHLTGGDDSPVLMSRDALSASFGGRADLCVGDDAAALAADLGAGHAHPRHPVAEAVARIAIARRHLPHGRPAPLYLRPADAAPSRMAPPVILP